MKTINKILYPISILMNAIGLINLGKDLFPSLIKWSQFLLKVLELFKAIRDVILYPLTGIISLFNFELHNWFKTYFFLGLLSYNTYNFSYRKICGSVSNISFFRVIYGSAKLRTFLAIIFAILFWPIHILSLLKHYFDKGYERKHNVYTLWGKYIFWVFFSMVAIVFVNWTFNTFIDDIFTYK